MYKNINFIIQINPMNGVNYCTNEKKLTLKQTVKLSVICAKTNQMQNTIYMKYFSNAQPPKYL